MYKKIMLSLVVLTVATPEVTSAQVFQRTFYTGTFNWLWSAGGNSLLMRGYESTAGGGRILDATACLWNDSNFSRTFNARIYVSQGGQEIQSIDFQRAFASMQVSCHTLSGFDAQLSPGEFSITVTYDRFTADNFWLRLPSTSNGQVFDVQIGSERPPFATGNQGPEMIHGVGIEYTIQESPVGPPVNSLIETGGLVLPGFEVDTNNPAGQTTFFASRNTTDSTLDLIVDFYGYELGDSPLRSDSHQLGNGETLSVNVRSSTAGLMIEEGIARGFALIYEDGAGADNLTGDYFRLDPANAFASGDRLVRPGEDFCDEQEIRFVDFGSGTRFQVLVDKPQGGDVATATYTALNEAGLVVATGDFFTGQHFTEVPLSEFVADSNFGTLILDFADTSGGGWISANYSAFGLYSVELEGRCKDGAQ